MERIGHVADRQLQCAQRGHHRGVDERGEVGLERRTRHGDCGALPTGHVTAVTLVSPHPAAHRTPALS